MTTTDVPGRGVFSLPVLPAEVAAAKARGLCSDYDPPTDPDGGCVTVPDWLHCWRHDPALGRCPFLD